MSEDIDTTGLPRCLISNEVWPPECIGETRVLTESDVAKGDESNAVADLWNAPGLFDSIPNPKMHLALNWMASYRAHRWTLIPMSSTLNSIINNLLKLRSEKQNAAWDVVYPPESEYKYKFVSIAMEARPILRVPNAWKRPYKIDDYIFHYADLPSLRCGTHPYIVIYKALRQYDHNSGELPVDAIEVYSKLFLIRSLWEELSAFSLVTSLPSGKNSKKRAHEEEAESPAKSQKSRVSSTKKSTKP